MINKVLPDPNFIWNIKTAPATEPITVEEVKLFARIDDDSEDTLLETFIETVRDSMEKYLGRALIEQTIRMVFDYWPTETIELPRPSLISIDKIFTQDEDDTETIYDSSNYYVITEAIPGQVILKSDSTSITNSERTRGGIGIEYKAGYGDSASDVPAAIRTAMMQWVTMIYEGRAEITEPPTNVKAAVSIFRVIKI